jgi:hypothetical protein
LPVLLNRFAPSRLLRQALLALQTLLSSHASLLNELGEIVKIELYFVQTSADLCKLGYVAKLRHRSLQAGV